MTRYSPLDKGVAVSNWPSRLVLNARTALPFLSWISIIAFSIILLSWSKTIPTILFGVVDGLGLGISPNSASAVAVSGFWLNSYKNSGSAVSSSPSASSLSVFSLWSLAVSFLAFGSWLSANSFSASAFFLSISGSSSSLMVAKKFSSSASFSSVSINSSRGADTGW